MAKTNLKKILKASVRGKVYFNRPLRRYTYFRIGGPAKLWIEPLDLEDLKNALLVCNRFKLPILLFGSGSNMLIDDKGLRKAVIRLSSPFFRRIDFCGNILSCGAGAALSKVSVASIKKGLAGLEFSAGIPGTVGGAVAMNAGSPDKTIGESVEWVKVMDFQGRLKELKKQSLKFYYRKTNLCDKIILQVGFKLRKSNAHLLKRKFKMLLKKKNKTQEMALPSAGCIFKNPSFSKQSSGQLLESVGLKGERIGGAQFSSKHANFIVNSGKAKSSDVESLIKLAQRKIKKRYNLWLEPEVKIIK